MVTHMKTTIELADGLLKDAKKLATREGTTLRAVIEAGVRMLLEARKEKKRPFKLRDASYGSGGLKEGFDLRDFKRILDVSYGDRGGDPVK